MEGTPSSTSVTLHLFLEISFLLKKQEIDVFSHVHVLQAVGISDVTYEELRGGYAVPEDYAPLLGVKAGLETQTPQGSLV